MTNEYIIGELRRFLETRSRDTDNNYEWREACGLLLALNELENNVCGTNKETYLQASNRAIEESKKEFDGMLVDSTPFKVTLNKNMFKKENELIWITKNHAKARYLMTLKDWLQYYFNKL